MSEPIANPYPEQVQKIAAEIIDIIEREFSGLTKKVYDGYGYPTHGVVSPAHIRVQMCIYI
jgi:hypothetical protein